MSKCVSQSKDCTRTRTYEDTSNNTHSTIRNPDDSESRKERCKHSSESEPGTERSATKIMSCENIFRRIMRETIHPTSSDHCHGNVYAKKDRDGHDQAEWCFGSLRHDDDGPFCSGSSQESRQSMKTFPSRRGNNRVCIDAQPNDALVCDTINRSKEVVKRAFQNIKGR